MSDTHIYGTVSESSDNRTTTLEAHGIIRDNDRELVLSVLEPHGRQVGEVWLGVLSDADDGLFRGTLKARRIAAEPSWDLEVSMRVAKTSDGGVEGEGEWEEKDRQTGQSEKYSIKIELKPH